MKEGLAGDVIFVARLGNAYRLAKGGADDYSRRLTGSFSMRCLSECKEQQRQVVQEGRWREEERWSRLARRDAQRVGNFGHVLPHTRYVSQPSHRDVSVCMIFPLDHFSHDLHLRRNTLSDTGRHDDDAPSSDAHTCQVSLEPSLPTAGP